MPQRCMVPVFDMRILPWRSACCAPTTSWALPTGSAYDFNDLVLAAANDLMDKGSVELIPAFIEVDRGARTYKVDLLACTPRLQRADDIVHLLARRVADFRNRFDPDLRAGRFRTLHRERGDTDL